MIVPSGRSATTFTELPSIRLAGRIPTTAMRRFRVKLPSTINSAPDFAGVLAEISEGGFFGSSAGSPSGDPPSTQSEIRWISSCVRA
jgi:hypothetical protein